MNGWLRRNHWYLVAIVVLAPLAMLAAMSTDWFPYQDRVNGHPIPVAEGDYVEYSGARWSLDNSFVVTARSDAGRSAELADDTELVVVSVRIDPSGAGDKSPSCTVRLEDRDGQRTWNTAQSREASVSIDKRASSGCDSTRLDGYFLQVFFLVPQGAGEGAHVIIESPDGLPESLSLDL